MNKSIRNTICKVLSVTVLPLCSVAVYADNCSGKTLFLYTGGSSLWEQGGAWFQLYYYGSSGNGWVTMESVPDEPGVWAATVPSGKNYSTVIFCRTEGGKPSKDWNYVWNQSYDLAFQESKNYYSITGWGSDKKCPGQWNSNHALIQQGSRIYFNNAKTNWANVYMQIVCKNANIDAGVGSYYPKGDCGDANKGNAFYKMTKYCGSIYYIDLPRHAYKGLLTFAADDQHTYDNFYATSVVLHYGWQNDYPCINPKDREFDNGRQTYVWSGDLMERPGTDLDDSPMKTIPVTPSQANPVVRGSEVTLKVESSQTWKWYSSTDGKTWSECTSSASGTGKNTLKVTPDLSTYYQVRDANNICNATYRVEVDIACKGSRTTLLDVDFDTDASGNYFTSESNRRAAINSKGEYINTTIYSYSGEGKEILDGFYTILANPKYGGCGIQQTTPGCDESSCLKNVRSGCYENEYWFLNIKDHTQPAGKIGGMLMANCKEKGEMIFSYSTGKLCAKNLYMTFSAWFANATKPNGTEKPIPINAKIFIMNKDRTENIAHINVVDVQPDGKWVNGKTAFFSGDNDELYVEVVNYGESGTGNDILIDDISFTACVPEVKFNPYTRVDCGVITTITVVPTGIDEIFQTTPYYLWQRYNYTTDKWENIPNDPTPGSGSYKGSGIGKTKYEFNILKEVGGKDPLFRVILAGTENAAKEVGAGLPHNCPDYAMTDEIIVDCNCLPQYINKSSGSDNQTICEGGAISNVVYAASGTTLGADVKGLPDGLTAAKSGKNVTISGTLPVIDKDFVYTIKVFAVDEPGISCESDTLELKINAKQKPTLTLLEGEGYGKASQSVCKEDEIVDIYYQWGGSATGASGSPANSGVKYESIADDKELKISGTPASTYTYTVSTTGQNAVCSPAKLSGTLTLYPTPLEPGVKYNEIK